MNSRGTPARGLARALALYAQILGRKFGIKVVHGNVGTAATDGKTIHIDNAYNGIGTQKEAETVFGLIAHEAMHLRLTDFDQMNIWQEKVAKKGDNWSVIKHLSNTHEDVWGETVFAEMYPSIWQDLVQSTLNLRCDGLYGPPDKHVTAPGANPASAFSGWWLFENLAVHYAHPVFIEDAKAWRAACRSILGDKLIDDALVLVPEVRKLRSTSAALELACEVYALIKAAAQAPTPQSAQPEQGGQAQQGDKGQKQEQGQQGQPEQGEKGDGKGQDGDKSASQGDAGKGGKEGAPGTDDQGGDGKGKDDAKDDAEAGQGGNGQPQKGDKSTDTGSADAKSKSDDTAGDSKAGSEGAQPGQPGKNDSAGGSGGAGSDADDAAAAVSAAMAASILNADEMALSECVTEKGDGFAQAKDNINSDGNNHQCTGTSDEQTAFIPCDSGFLRIKSGIRSHLDGRLEQLLAANAEIDRIHMRRGNRIASARLPLIRLGRTDVFERSDIGVDQDTVVDVLVDGSGSMKHIWTNTLAAGYAVADVLSTYHVPFGLAQFSGTFRRIHDFDARWNRSTAKVPAPLLAGTRTSFAINLSSTALFARPEARKIMLVLTDGAPDCTDSAVAIAVEAALAGIDVIHLFIGESGHDYEVRLRLTRLGFMGRCIDPNDFLGLARQIESALADSMKDHLKKAA